MRKYLSTSSAECACLPFHACNLLCCADFAGCAYNMLMDHTLIARVHALVDLVHNTKG